ncbi:homoserine dehydrogenase [Gemmatimonas groenlandica]|uniref:Homoserine O-acetyltransferase n=1 Tax=Gemmatimonas groenlandica TaxID=2732249 RepID=A0A6M4IM83_9BACT|nr:homoserine O-acetyltransferase [Gemmatimonas groenlandica]QJR34577.1 homoserine O-acetyltransferase [Gemmatimonas groenlandica]
MSTLPSSLLVGRAAVRVPRSSIPSRATVGTAKSGTSAWPIRDETITFHDVALERGDRLDRVDVRYRLEGTLDAARDNVVLVVHALTGTTHASDWWKGVIGANAAIDPTKHAVLCANLLGGCDGTTGPTDDNPDALPPFSTRDQATVLARLLDSLGITAPLLVCGGSLGGMVALEFAASFPDRVRSAVVLAAPAAQTAQGIAWNAIMRRAIALGGVREGLALARMVGMLSYRTPEGLERRFGRSRSEHDTFQVRDWLEVHGDKLVSRFDATSYGALIDAMDEHDVGRNRGGLSAALSVVGDRLIGVGIPGDLLYPAESVREWTTAAKATYVELPSIHGHDAFLLEVDRVSAVIAKAIAESELRNASAPARAAATTTPIVTSVTPRVRPLRVALAGCGHVGGSLLDLFGERAQQPGDAQPIRVDRVLVRDAERPRPALAQAIARGIAAPDACITDPTLLLSDDIDVLVEAIGGTTTARTLVETALRRGIRVVTANKALLGERGSSLAALARITDTRLDFEGAVCGAIPIVRCVRSGAAGVGITKVSGILNGTSNYVLEKVAEGASLAEAVATAQRLGYAEADPTRDLSGQDAEDKLRILAWMCFGVDPATLKVTRRGIDAETAAWATRVALEGDRVKLIASCTREGDELVARIFPTRITSDDPWARVSGPFNRIVVESETAGSLVFQGPGAGGRATAGAVLADIVAR